MILPGSAAPSAAAPTYALDAGGLSPEIAPRPGADTYDELQDRRAWASGVGSIGDVSAGAAVSRATDAYRVSGRSAYEDATRTSLGATGALSPLPSSAVPALGFGVRVPSRGVLDSRSAGAARAHGFSPSGAVPTGLRAAFGDDPLQRSGSIPYRATGFEPTWGTPPAMNGFTWNASRFLYEPTGRGSDRTSKLSRQLAREGIYPQAYKDDLSGTGTWRYRWVRARSAVPDVRTPYEVIGPIDEHFLQKAIRDAKEWIAGRLEAQREPREKQWGTDAPLGGAERVPEQPPRVMLMLPGVMELVEMPAPVTPSAVTPPSSAPLGITGVTDAGRVEEPPTTPFGITGVAGAGRVEEPLASPFGITGAGASMVIEPEGPRVGTIFVPQEPETVISGSGRHPPSAYAWVRQEDLPVECPYPYAYMPVPLADYTSGRWLSEDYVPSIPLPPGFADVPWRCSVPGHPGSGKGKKPPEGPPSEPGPQGIVPVTWVDGVRVTATPPSKEDKPHDDDTWQAINENPEYQEELENLYNLKEEQRQLEEAGDFHGAKTLESKIGEQEKRVKAVEQKVADRFNKQRAKDRRKQQKELENKLGKTWDPGQKAEILAQMAALEADINKSLSIQKWVVENDVTCAPACRDDARHRAESTRLQEQIDASEKTYLELDLRSDAQLQKKLHSQLSTTWDTATRVQLWDDLEQAKRSAVESLEALLAMANRKKDSATSLTVGELAALNAEVERLEKAKKDAVRSHYETAEQEYEAKLRDIAYRLNTSHDPEEHQRLAEERDKAVFVLNYVRQVLGELDRVEDPASLASERAPGAVGHAGVSGPAGPEPTGPDVRSMSRAQLDAEQNKLKTKLGKADLGPIEAEILLDKLNEVNEERARRGAHGYQPVLPYPPPEAAAHPPGVVIAPEDPPVNLPPAGSDDFPTVKKNFAEDLERWQDELKVTYPDFEGTHRHHGRETKTLSTQAAEALKWYVDAVSAAQQRMDASTDPTRDDAFWLEEAVHRMAAKMAVLNFIIENHPDKGGDKIEGLIKENGKLEGTWKQSVHDLAKLRHGETVEGEPNVQPGQPLVEYQPGMPWFTPDPPLMSMTQAQRENLYGQIAAQIRAALDIYALARRNLDRLQREFAGQGEIDAAQRGVDEAHAEIVRLLMLRPTDSRFDDLGTAVFQREGGIDEAVSRKGLSTQFDFRVIVLQGGFLAEGQSPTWSKLGEFVDLPTQIAPVGRVSPPLAIVVAYPVNSTPGTPPAFLALATATKRAGGIDTRYLSYTMDPISLADEGGIRIGGAANQLNEELLVQYGDDTTRPGKTDWNAAIAWALAPGDTKLDDRARKDLFQSPVFGGKESAAMARKRLHPASPSSSDLNQSAAARRPDEGLDRPGQ